MKQYVVDAFTHEIFKGNPAAVCLVKNYPDDALMEKIAMENNLSETAFIKPEADGSYHLRWFTPGGEIDFCGHATLGSAWVVLNELEPKAPEVLFHTMKGDLKVSREENLYVMDFPAYDLEPVPVTAAMIEALGASVKEAYMGRDLLCILDDEETVKNLEPAQDLIRELPWPIVHVTAAGKDYDCVSRSFAPKLLIAEDPVCGSGHCHIAPYWMKKLGREALTAFQASKRSGVLYCAKKGDRLLLKGEAVKFAESETFIKEC